MRFLQEVVDSSQNGLGEVAEGLALAAGGKRLIKGRHRRLHQLARTAARCWQPAAGRESGTAVAAVLAYGLAGDAFAGELVHQVVTDLVGLSSQVAKPCERDSLRERSACGHGPSAESETDERRRLGQKAWADPQEIGLLAGPDIAAYREAARRQPGRLI